MGLNSSTRQPTKSTGSKPPYKQQPKESKTVNISEQAVEAAAKAIQVEWGITPWGELSYQAERALAINAKDAIVTLAREVLETAAPLIEPPQN
jgi:hypothetical protein